MFKSSQNPQISPQFYLAILESNKSQMFSLGTEFEITEDPKKNYENYIYWSLSCEELKLNHLKILIYLFIFK